MIRRPTLSYTALAALTILVNACALEKADELDTFLQPLPEAEHVRVTGPEGQDGAGARLMAAGVAAAEPAEWYLFTRDVRDDVNAVTASVLGSVWRLVQARPTEIEADAAVWGPYTDGLDPVIWQFRVQRVAAHEYEYTLEGRRKLGDPEFVPVLQGTGFDRGDERHGDGRFVIDLDAARRLDPGKHAADSGTLSVTHELPWSISRELGPLPRTLHVEARASDAGSLDVTSIAKADGTGELVVDAEGDIDESKATLPENVHVESRWRADGAGRADIRIHGGDLPASVEATECWGRDFARTHYADSVNFAPAEGDASACIE